MREDDTDGMPPQGKRDGLEMRAATWAMLLGLPTLYFAAFFNRFAGLRSGAGEFGGGVAFLRGMLPYRDYYTAGPPLNTLKSALLLWCFGPALIVSRAAGVAERLLLAGVLYLWLRRLFGRVPALVASVATVILSAADCTDPIASYNHDAILWAVLSGWLASRALGGETGGGGTVLAGVAAGLAILTKQTVGLASAVTVGLCLAVMVARLRGRRQAGASVLRFAGGCVVPVGTLMLMLWRFGVAGTMLQMLFVAGPRAKAPHAADFLWRELTVAWGNAGWVVLGVAALALAWRPLRHGVRRSESRDERAVRRATLVWAGLGGLVAVGGAVLLAWTPLPALHDVTKSAVYFAFAGVSVVFARGVWRLQREAFTVRRAEMLLLAAVSGAVAASLSLSWPAFEAMLVPGIGLLVAALLSGARGRGLAAAHAGVALIVFLSVREKLDRPFLFDGQQELPVRLATERSALPMMRGMRLPASTVALLDGTARIVAEHTEAGDRIFTYPEMGLLYAVTGRQPPTLAGSHNMDVVNDAMAREDARRLLEARPRVLVRYRQTDAEVRAAERLWRHGAPSGQRALVAAVEELTRSYALAATYRLAPEDAAVEVWVRPDGR